MGLSPQLTFNGQCEAAFEFYERYLGGKITFKVTWGNSPVANQAPPEWRDKILHASLTLCGTVLMGCDVLPGQYEAPKGFSVHLAVSDPLDAERIFSALADKGIVRMPMQETSGLLVLALLSINSAHLGKYSAHNNNECSRSSTNTARLCRENPARSWHSIIRSQIYFRPGDNHFHDRHNCFVSYKCDQRTQ